MELGLQACSAGSNHRPLAEFLARKGFPFQEGDREIHIYPYTHRETYILIHTERHIQTHIHRDKYVHIQRYRHIYIYTQRYIFMHVYTERHRHTMLDFFLQ